MKRLVKTQWRLMREAEEKHFSLILSQIVFYNASEFTGNRKVILSIGSNSVPLACFQSHATRRLLLFY